MRNGLVCMGLVAGCAAERERGEAPDDPGWLDVVRQGVAASEYAPVADGSGLRTTNRAHELRARFSASGVSLTSRTRGGEAVMLSLSSFGREGATALVAPATPGLGACDSTDRLDAFGDCLRRIQYERAPGLIEWWENRTDGLQQGFTVASRPEGAGELALALDVRGARLESDGPSAVWLRSDTQQVRYAGLAAWDERGTALPARMEVRDDALWLLVDDRRAAGAITIDPVLTTPSWSAEGDQVQAYLGCSVSGAGDTNGDGFDDVVVGAYGYDGGLVNEGKAWLYLGSPSGLATAAAWSAEGEQASAWFGYAVSNAGDVNGDGMSDVIVGAYSYDNGQSNEGRAFLYFGTNLGLAAVPLWLAEGDQADAHFGESVAAAGDTNGDGYGDVLVGASGYDSGQSNEGRAFLYLGSASGLGASPAWTAEGDQVNAYLGRSVSAAGDTNGDGYGDVLVGAEGYDSGQSSDGRAFVYFGSPTGLAATPAWSADGDQDLAFFGGAVAAAGDTNGDGYADILVGAAGYDSGQTDEGRAFLYLGSPSGPLAAASWTAEGDQAGAAFGSSVSGAGDTNGDGYADLLIGAEGYDGGNTDEGRAHVYFGSGSGPLAAASWTAESDQLQARFGSSVSAAGDTNGDGFGDILVGAEGYDGGQSDEGRASLYLGSPSGLSLQASTFERDQAGAGFGVSVASAGDIDGDGYDDVVVGASDYDNGQSNEGRVFLYRGSPAGLTASSWSAEIDQISAYFGISVSSGDVDGDGYSDVIVGAPGASISVPDEGGAFVYRGSPSGLSAGPAWSAYGGQSSSQFGYDVAFAGDVNGDGYGDILVGANAYSAGEVREGAAFAYFGSPEGLSASALWTAEGDQSDAHFGVSVASAGDIDGDGYSDVVIGAPDYDDGQTNEGSAFVYLGHPGGISTTPTWTARSDQSNARFGGSVASAGDVNGDGYSDILVGAAGYDNGQPDEGRVYLYAGGTLSATPAWIWEPDQPLLGVGRAVASAGDVNGDGYSDIIVGATSTYATSGVAFVHLGSPVGLSATPAWTVDEIQEESNYGAAVASAGDVNGDGYSDVLVGASGYDNGQTDEGRAFLYLGNGGDGTGPGLSVAPQSRRQGSAIPIAPGLTADGFDVALRTARGPWGRAPVALRMQGVALPGSFADPRYTLSREADAGTVGTLLQDELTALRGFGYRWRVRAQISASRGAKQSAGAWKYGGVVYTVYTVCPDADLDTYGDHERSRNTRIGGAEGYLYCDMLPDCDDSRPDVNPGAQEVCDDADTDEDCDALADDADDSVAGQTPWYLDLDTDGYGAGSPALSCDALPGTVPVGGDCDDGRGDVNPGAQEVCDDADTDEDCDTLADDADDSATGKLTFWIDVDNDGYGSDVEATLCDLREGYAPNPDDCADTVAAIHPGAQEVCDPMDIDEDCDTLADDADDSVAGQTSWYLDLDEDGFGGGSPALSCEALPDHTSVGGDCDDSLASIHPQATEAPGDGIDSDCDGTELCFADADEDGQRTEQIVPSADADCLDAGEAPASAPSGDCDDGDPEVHAAAAERPGDGRDSDCDGIELCFLDADSDGYRSDDDATTPSADLACAEDGLASLLTPTGDCDDSDPAYYPSAPEDCADPADYNCDGFTGYADADGDGYAACEDCDDGDPSRHPGAEELEGDGIDSDCDGQDPDDKGCGCAQVGPRPGPALLLALLALPRLRRRCAEPNKAD